ncbi:hypothetical protein ACFQ1S_06940 [Kibdelosporangium lantanae]|uniref:DUF4254 domain-containing protein n=1 Tax=Kibdelosporangium lantanae TaxID=1497396 RepID=A0ABW3M7M9_9PSEU
MTSHNHIHPQQSIHDTDPKQASDPPTTMDPKVLTALRDVIDYTWPDEETALPQKGDPDRIDHIYHALKMLQTWADQQGNHPVDEPADDRPEQLRDAIEACETMFDAIDSVDRVLGELADAPTPDSDEFQILHGKLRAGTIVLRHVADTIEALADRV